jgi:hypothetical protein
MVATLHGYPELRHTEQRDAMIRSLVRMIDRTFLSLGRTEALERLAIYFGTLDDGTLSNLCYKEVFCEADPVMPGAPDPEC